MVGQVGPEVASRRRVSPVVRASEPAAMREQLRNGRLLGPRVCRPAVRPKELRKCIRQRRLERQPTVAHEGRNAGAGDGLGQACKMIGPVRIGSADCSAMNDPTIAPHHDDRLRNPVLCRPGRQHLRERFRPVGERGFRGFKNCCARIETAACAQPLLEHRSPCGGVAGEARVAIGLVRRKLDEASAAAPGDESLEPGARGLLAPVPVVLAVQPQRRDPGGRPVGGEQSGQQILAAGTLGPRVRRSSSAAGEVDGGRHARDVLRRHRDRGCPTEGLSDHHSPGRDRRRAMFSRARSA